MDTIDYGDMVKTLAKSGDTIAAEMTGPEAHRLHMAIGICGEVGELIKAICLQDEKNILEELGDLEFYPEGLRQSLGVTVEECVSAALNSVTGTLETPSGMNDAMLSLSVIAGEIVDVVKREAIYRKPLNLIAAMTFLGHLEISLEFVQKEIGFTREQCCEANIAKLGKRYEGLKYSDASAQQRADKKDEKVEESKFAPYEQRVIQEKAELDDKAKKLSTFIGENPLFEKLDGAEQERMKVQNDLMWQLSDVLSERIHAFPVNVAIKATNRFEEVYITIDGDRMIYEYRPVGGSLQRMTHDEDVSDWTKDDCVGCVARLLGLNDNEVKMIDFGHA
jgi:hypothetical protein